MRNLREYWDELDQWNGTAGKEKRNFVSPGNESSLRESQESIPTADSLSRNPLDRWRLWDDEKALRIIIIGRQAAKEGHGPRVPRRIVAELLREQNPKKFDKKGPEIRATDINCIGNHLNKMEVEFDKPGHEIRDTDIIPIGNQLDKMKLESGKAVARSGQLISIVS